MKPADRFYGLVLIMLVSLPCSCCLSVPGQAQAPQTGMLITGFIHDRQGTAVQGAHVSLLAPGRCRTPRREPHPTRWALHPCALENPADELSVHVAREHFREEDLPLTARSCNRCAVAGQWCCLRSPC